MRVIFENELGVVTLNGEGNEGWRIKGITGLGPVAKTYHTARYVNIAGQETLFEIPNERIITIKGDIVKKNGFSQMFADSLRILNSQGTLKIIYEQKQRKINCRMTVFEEGEVNNAYMSFVMQFVADCPYFEDIADTYVPLFMRTNLIDGDFILPTMFSSRTSGNTVENSGDVNAEPAFYVYAKTASLQPQSYGIEIKNNSTGATFKLNYCMQSGQTVVADIKKRSVYDTETKENLVSNISNTTFLCECYLKKGENVLECINYDALGDIEVFLRFSNKYIEAVG